MKTMPNYLEVAFNEIMAMDEDEFARELEKHKNGDIAIALLESGALSKSSLTGIAKGWVEYVW